MCEIIELRDMYLVEVGSVMVLTTGKTTSTGMLAMFTLYVSH